MLILRDRKYLSDPTEDVQTATKNLLSDFLHEIQEVTKVQKSHEEELRAKQEAENADFARRMEGDKDRLPDITMAHSEKATFIPVPEPPESPFDDQDTPVEKSGEYEERDLGSGYEPALFWMSLNICPL